MALGACSSINSVENAQALTQRRPADLDLSSEEERQQTLVTWNQTQQDYARDLCVHELVQVQAARRPDAVAAVAGDRQLDYRTLNGRANQLAHCLRRLGAGPETLVGVCLTRGPELLIGLLAVLKAGAAYVPLDPAYPQARLAFMLKDARALALLTLEELRQRLLMPGLPLICLDAERRVAQESSEDLDSGVHAGNLAYVIYTSGTTGQPKGVEIEHGSLMNLVSWHQSAFGVSPADRATQIAGLGFDASVWEVWPYLAVGASIHLPDEDTRLSPARLQAWLLSNAITVCFLPTPLAERVLELSWPAKTALRTLLTGGDTLYTYPAPGLPFQLVNNYGPTEDTVVTTSQIVPPQTRADVPPSIGRPIWNTQVYLLNARLRPVPLGKVGELCIGGDGLARGYLNQPGLTAEAFVPQPFTPPALRASRSAVERKEGGKRLYRTGDLARYRPDGSIEFLGRADDQVKIRGFRIELGEVEALLRSHPAVRETAVLAWRAEGEQGEKRLVAYVVARDRGLPAASELRRYLEQKLPAYMLPAAFVTLEALPLTPHGKVDRQALPAPRLHSQAAFVAPRTRLEQTLVTLYSEVLGVEKLSLHDDFFELGGHSLLAAQVASRLGQRLGREFSLRTLFEAPTVAALAASIEKSLPAEQGVPAPPIARVSRAEPLVPSFAQEQLWLIDQLEPGNVAYNISYPLRLIGLLDVVALEETLNEIIRRHGALRTTFGVVEGRPVQIVAPTLTLHMPLVDLCACPAATREAQVRHLARAQARRPFDLAQSPLIRATLLRTRVACSGRRCKDEHILLLTMHHIVVDGWSVGVLLAELEALYPAFVAGAPSPLPDLPVQYADYAAWQRGWLQGAVLDRQLAYWMRQLKGAPTVLSLPTDRPRPPVQTYRGERCDILLPMPLAEGLKALSQRHGSTLFMTLLAAFKALLQGYTRERDIVVGSPVANRNRPEIERLIGYFVNTLVLRTDLGGDPTFCELLGRVRETALEAYAHQELPFQKLVQALLPETDRRYNPLFQVMFTFQNAPLAMPTLPGLAIAPVSVDAGIAQFDVDLTMEETEAGISGVIEYNTDLFDRATIRRMLDHYRALLESVVDDPDQALSALLCDLKVEMRRPDQAGSQPQPEADQDIPGCIRQRRARLSRRRAQLSDEQRALLDQRLRGE